MDEGGGFDGELGWLLVVGCEGGKVLVVERTFDANIVAVTLRQSLQWQTCVLTRSSPSTGWYLSVDPVAKIISVQSRKSNTYDLKLDSAAITSRRCSLRM